MIQKIIFLQFLSKLNWMKKWNKNIDTVRKAKVIYYMKRVSVCVCVSVWIQTDKLSKQWRERKRKKISCTLYKGQVCVCVCVELASRKRKSPINVGEWKTFFFHHWRKQNKKNVYISRLSSSSPSLMMIISHKLNSIINWLNNKIK